MLKKILACSAIAMLVLTGSAVLSMGSDTGPEEITMVGSKSAKPKPAVFPHKMHQEKFECAECHHGMADGKQVPYAEGMEIQKCETCHNEEVLAGKTADKLKLDTIKGAGHGNCLACHKEMVKKDAELKAKKINSCKTCHQK
ncbi:cytochrome c3 family protein [Desulforhopalus singaporensis]|uniref:Class III cytochrome C family protein n=1 Tax=Desulforhopalus singaporensis TaxID=91360 RepID=A0A1H0QMU5_9BACT|nr:cytochrome c3 family protein [Desulforhopalus singaporensis]SDP18693.1 Class III cytochrome C family protein [Desulforhopalus singaporensis]